MELGKRIVVECALLVFLRRLKGYILSFSGAAVGRSNDNCWGGDSVQDDSASNGSNRGSGNIMDTIRRQNL